MAYYIFSKDFSGLTGTLYRVAETESDFNNSNIDKTNYKIIENSAINFNDVKYYNKIITGYNENEIICIDGSISFINKEELDIYINSIKELIKSFLVSNTNHSLYSLWNNYYNQILSLNTSDITYPLNTSLEEYFNNLNKISLNPLQLP